MGMVGGDPANMSGGAAELHRCGVAVKKMESGLSSAASAAASSAGDPTLVAAVRRFGAAWSTTVGDTGTQIQTAAQLASNAAADLSTVGGH